MKSYKSKDRLTFGKHKGLTIDRVSQLDPSYITWMHDQRLCDTKTIDRHNRSELRNDDLKRGYARVFTW